MTELETKIALLDFHTCANYETECHPYENEFKCKNFPLNNKFGDKKYLKKK